MIEIEFNIKDLWIGLSWNYTDKLVDVYMCIIPFVPIHIQWRRKKYLVRKSEW